MMDNQWRGKKVAFLGDSVTDAAHIGTTRNYWQYLADFLGLEPLVYGLNGWRWNGVKTQAEKLFAEHGDAADAIVVFMGTNDYNSGTPLGEWYDVRDESVNSHGQIVTRPRRSFRMDESTLRGCINIGMKYLKEHFPRRQIILLTMLHRGFAEFGGTNVQPDESFPNDIGLYVEEYVKVVKEAGNVWSVPVIDLNALAGLNPNLDVHAGYFHDAATDRLHPSAAGHERIARTLMYQMLALPAGF